MEFYLQFIAFYFLGLQTMNLPSEGLEEEGYHVS